MKIDGRQLRLYAVTDRRWLKEGETLEAVVEELIQAGVTIIQLREKEQPDDFVIEEAIRVKAVCDRYGVPLIINDRPDIAKTVHASGVHVGLEDMGIARARAFLGPDYIIGGSAHNVGEAISAQEAGADYIGCGAVFGSTTKTNVSNLMTTELKKICENVSIPVVAIGGINLENVSELAGSGISGVAVISAVFAAEDKKGAVKDFLKIKL